MVQPHDEVMVEVELVDDDESAAAPARRPARLRPRRRLLGAVLAVLAMVAAGALTAVLRARAPQDGAVDTLDEPLRAQWQTTGAVLGAVGDDVVVQSDIFQVREVRTIDASTGNERWSVRLGANGVATTCMPVVTADPAAVWCVRNRRMVADPVTGESSVQDPAVLGLGLEDGAVVVEQAVRPPSAGIVAVGADLVLGDRVDAELTVRRVDARTWEPIWTATVDLLPRTTDGLFDARIAGAEELVVVLGPTVTVLRASDGAVLALWEPVVDPVVRTLDAAEVAATATGFAAWTELDEGVRTSAATWYDLDGTEVLDLDGGWAEPAASDGTGAGALLISRVPGSVTALDTATGRELWSASAAGGTLLRHDDAVVIADGDTLASIEVLSGLRRWSVQVPGLRPGAGAVSDGYAIAVLAFRDARWRMVAVDLHSGEERWSTSAPGIPEITEEVNLGGQARLSAVGGYAVVGWGRTLTWAG